MSLIPCEASVESRRKAIAGGWKNPPDVHTHLCKNGPSDQRPDLHVCETCGSCFKSDPPASAGGERCPYCEKAVFVDIEDHWYSNPDCGREAKRDKLVPEDFIVSMFVLV